MLKDIARNIRHVRKKQNVTISDLAGAAGISASHLSQIERGQKEPSLDTLGNLAGALNVTPASLLNARGIPLLSTEAFKFLAWVQRNKITDDELTKLQRVYLAMRGTP